MMKHGRHQTPSRRRFLTGLGGACLALSLPRCKKQQAREEPEPDVGVYQWSGIGFGIEMSMEIHGVTESRGLQLGAQCEQIIAGLERSFSLYLENSELSRLNRERTLERPSEDFVDLLDRAISLEARTLGYYQPAIHGAWRWLEKNEFRIDTGRRAEWQAQCAAADVRHIQRMKSGGIRLSHPLTQLSMNAICQGYLADRVAGRLRADGVSRALLHLGETYALGSHPEGRPWKLAVMGTGDGAGLVGEVELADAGLAVSANEPGRLLIDPVDASLQQHDRVAAVVSKEGAAVADAFATAFAVAPGERWEALGDSLMAGSACAIKVWEQNRLCLDV